MISMVRIMVAGSTSPPPSARGTHMRKTPPAASACTGSGSGRRWRAVDVAAALGLVEQIAAIAEAEGHHPDIGFGWGYCRVVFYTHKIKGLHENDFIMAAKVNALAAAS